MSLPEDDPRYDITRKPARRKPSEPEDVQPVDDETDAPARPRKKLGSLAQKARGKHLNQARALLIVIGVLTVIINLFDLVDTRKGFRFMSPREALEQAIYKQNAGAPKQLVDQVVGQMAPVLTLSVVVFVGLGLVFIVFGLVIKVIPVVATVTSLVLYVVGNVVTAIMVLHFANDKAAELLASGIIVKIIIVVCLIKAIQAAIAYERERREEAAYEADAD
jgi:hypothetical protein